MKLNWPWKIYEGDSFTIKCYHYIWEGYQKKVGEVLKTLHGSGTIKRISEETREIWVEKLQ